MNNEKKYMNYLYYFIVGVISFISLVFLPMIGSEGGIAFNVPDTVSGWIIYITTKLIAAIINVMIFHSFICQAKINVKDNPNYLEAIKILQNIKAKDYVPRSLKVFNKREYSRKGLLIVIFSVLSIFAIAQSVLVYDYAALLAYVLTVIMGIVFGVFEMKKYEEYYTSEYLDYAKLEELKKAAEKVEETKRAAEEGEITNDK